MCEGVKEQEQNENLGSFDFSRIIRQTAVHEPQIGEEEESMKQSPPASRVDYTDINSGKKLSSSHVTPLN